jgi:hypothetical protein
MALDAQEVMVAGSGHLWVADLRDNPSFPAANAAPTATLDTEFMDLGYTTEDGPTFTVTPTVEDLNAWQSFDPIRRLVTSRVTSVAASLMQWNQSSFNVAFGGGTWSQPTAGVFRYDPPADDEPLPEFAMVLDVQDGDKDGRFVLYRTNIADAVETTFTRAGAAVLPITATTLRPDDQNTSWYFVGNDPAFAYAS